MHCLRKSLFWLIMVIAFALLFFSMVAELSAEKGVLGIFNFRPTNIEAMGYNGDILYALTTTLELEKDIEVMSRREMENMLFQKGLVQTDNPDMVLKAGEILGINFILFGKVTKSGGGGILAVLNLIDIVEKQVINSWSLSFSGGEAINREIPAFVGELKEAIANRKQPPPASEVEEKIYIENFQAKGEKGKVALQWEFEPIQSISAFHIYRSVKKEGPYQFLGKTEKNVFIDGEPKEGQFYYYHIRIFLTSGEEIRDKKSVKA